MSNGNVELLRQGPPPYIRFEQRAEEDRDQTISAGRLVLKDVDYVVITRAGSKDCVEKPALEWLEHCEQQARENPPLWPPDWIRAHRKMYDQWKAGQEVTEPGFPIRQWAAISKAQAENLNLTGVKTVEHLAAADESTIQRIGLGGRELKERARAWLETNKGNKGEELAALRAENADLKTQLGSQGEKIAELEAAILGMQKPEKRRA